MYLTQHAVNTAELEPLIEKSHRIFQLGHANLVINNGQKDFTFIYGTD